MPKKFKKDSTWFPYVSYITHNQQSPLEVVEYNRVKRKKENQKNYFIINLKKHNKLFYYSHKIIFNFSKFFNYSELNYFLYFIFLI